VKSAKPGIGQSRAGEYAAALSSFLSGDGEVALRRAYEIGRAALSESVDLLEIIAMHHQALEQMIARGSGDRPLKVRAAGVFLAEALSAYEMVYRGFRERNAALRHINEALEQESRRIALLLHDELGQSLFAAELSLSELEVRVDSRHREEVRKIVKMLYQIEEQMRSLSHEVRPTVLDDLGLVPALEFLAGGIFKRKGITVSIRASFQGRLAPAVEAALFRIVQEALANVVRHSKADYVEVALEKNGNMLSCSVSDDGLGFDTGSLTRRSDGLGLSGIRERLNSIGGTLKIQSEPGQGTQLLMLIPSEV